MARLHVKDQSLQQQPGETVMNCWISYVLASPMAKHSSAVEQQKVF
jgi:hypothetical protein